MQIAIFDFAAKAAALKALSIAVEIEYVQTNRAHWLTLNALHYAFGQLAGAANKLETAPQDAEDTFSVIQTVIQQIAAVESLLSTIDIERVRTDAVYAGSQLKRAEVARNSAEAVDQLAIAVAKVVQTKSAVVKATERRTAFIDASATKKRFAVVKGDFTHTKGGSPLRFHTGWHCDIDRELQEGGMLIGAGDWSVPFTGEEIGRLFDIVEA